MDDLITIDPFARRMSPWWTRTPPNRWHPHAWQVTFADNVSYTTVPPWSEMPQEVIPRENDTPMFGPSYPRWAKYQRHVTGMVNY